MLIYSAYADAHMIVAGADGIANKGGNGDDLCQAIRAAARGRPAFPTVSPTAVSAMAARLEPSDVPILGMLVHGDLAAEFADALGITEPSLDARRWAILKRLTAPPGRPDPPRPPQPQRTARRRAPACPSATGACAMTASPSAHHAERAPHCPGASRRAADDPRDHRSSSVNPRSRVRRVGRLRPGGPEDRWLALFLVTRALATGTAVLLLGVHRVTPYDGGLIALALAYSTASMLAFARSRQLQRSPAAWLVDAAAVLALIAAAQDWRSPF